MVISSGFRTNHRLPRPATLARYSAVRSNIIRTDVRDETMTSGDDHIVLVVGEREGSVLWRQVGTTTLLADLES